MFTVIETATIDHPVDEVFAFVSDGANRPLWDPSVISEELLSPPPIGVGSRLRSRMTAVGREVEFEFRVTDFEAPHRMRITSVSGPLPTTVTFDLTPDGERTRLAARIDGEPAGMMRFVEPMIEQGVRSNLSAGVARIQALLEARTARG